MEIREIKTFEIFISNALFVPNTTIVFNFFIFFYFHQVSKLQYL